MTTTADGGRYSCSAVNIGGEATKTFVVKVKGISWLEIAFFIEEISNQIKNILGRPFYDIDPTNYDIILKCPPIADKADQIIWEEILLEDKENITNPITENSTDLVSNLERLYKKTNFQRFFRQLTISYVSANVLFPPIAYSMACRFAEMSSSDICGGRAAAYRV